MKKLLLIVFFVLLPIASFAADQQICFTIPDAQVTRVISALSEFYDYQEELPIEGGATEPNPETKPQFIKRKIKEQIKKNIVAQESRAAAKVAEITARGAAEAEIDLQD